MNRHQRRTAAAQTKETLPDANVYIGIPSGDHWFAKFAMDTIMVVLDTLGYPTPGFRTVSCGIRNVRGSVIWKQRSDLVETAIKDGYTHLLFVDTDQTFPANTLRRLLAHKKPVVACNVAVKKFPSNPTARNLVNGDVRMVFTTEKSTGLEEVWRIGTGIMLIDLSIMDKVEKPWFKVSWGGEGEQYGEDWWFCSQIQKAGFPIFIDHDLSWDVGHLGFIEYDHRMVPDEMIEESMKMAVEG